MKPTYFWHSCGNGTKFNYGGRASNIILFFKGPKDKITTKVNCASTSRTMIIKYFATVRVKIGN